LKRLAVEPLFFSSTLPLKRLTKYFVKIKNQVFSDAAGPMHASENSR
jgi:hypothetical protein